MNFPRFRGRPAGTALASNRIPDIPFSALPREISRTLRAAARWLADKENASDQIGGVNLN